MWCKTGFPRRWVGHTCCPDPSHHDNCKSWSWDRTAEGAGGYRRTEHDAGAGSCPRTYPSGGRWPPCRRRSEGPPPWWQLLMRTPQPLTAPDHSWNHSSLVHSSDGLKHDPQWSKAGLQRGVGITHQTPLFLSSPSHYLECGWARNTSMERADEGKKGCLAKRPPCTFASHIASNCQRREACKSFVSYKDYHDNIVSLLERRCFFAALCWMVNFNLKYFLISYSFMAITVCREVFINVG